MSTTQIIRTRNGINQWVPVKRIRAKLPCCGGEVRLAHAAPCSEVTCRTCGQLWFTRIRFIKREVNNVFHQVDFAL